MKEVLEMIIPIRKETGEIQEWCMLEFQGEILGDDLSGKELGKMEIKEV